jgi:hypothetical protein
VRGTKRRRRAPRDHPLIYPALIQLAKRLKSRRVRVDDRAPRQPPALWSDKVVPRELVPFFTSLDLGDLVKVIERYPWLYWHPLVRQEMFCLMHLSRAPWAWDDVGWQWGEDQRPREVAEVNQRLQELLVAHAKYLLPHKQAKLVDPPPRRDRKGGLKNPRPRWPGDEFITAQQLYVDWYDLKLAIKLFDKDRALLRPLKASYKKIAHAALKNSAPSWSNHRPDQFRQVVDAQGRATYEYCDDNWDVDLDPVIKWVCNENELPHKMRKVEKRGHLAYAILGALLADDPGRASSKAMEVLHRVEHYRRQERHRHPSR